VTRLMHGFEAERRGQPLRLGSKLCTGAQWADLPERYPPYQTCHRRYQRWVGDGLFEHILQGVGARPHGARWTRSLRVLHRWHIHRGEKRGGCGSDQAGQRDETHGSGRPSWSSSRHLCRLGFASRDSPRRPHARLTIRRRAPAAPHWRPRLRRRFIGCRVSQAGRRDDRAASAQSQAAQNARRTTTAALQTPLEDRVPLCLAGQFSSPRGALRAFCPQLPSITLASFSSAASSSCCATTAEGISRRYPPRPIAG
jgi:uncharacterized membrane protein